MSTEMGALRAAALPSPYNRIISDKYSPFLLHLKNHMDFPCLVRMLACPGYIYYNFGII